MAVLRANDLCRLLKTPDGSDTTELDPFVITPRPDLDAMAETGAASVDLRLGCWFVSPRRSRMTHYDVGCTDAQGQFAKTHYVPFSTQYVLHPHGFVLGTTLEWLRVPRSLFAYVIGKSSWGRRGLIIATATAVHPGFTGCLTLELSNVGEVPIVIYPGMAICQLCIHRVEPGETAPGDGSRFVGYRRPVVGEMYFDKVAGVLRNPKA